MGFVNDEAAIIVNTSSYFQMSISRVFVVPASVRLETPRIPGSRWHMQCNMAQSFIIEHLGRDLLLLDGTHIHAHEYSEELTPIRYRVLGPTMKHHRTRCSIKTG